MNIEIDQSGRVEVTSHNTVIAFSNGKRKGILLKSKDKREIQKIFRKAGKGRIFVIRIFSLLIFLLIKHEKKIDNILIDTEYPGWEAQIKNYIVSDFRRNGIKFEVKKIRFGQVGKKCEAHWHSNLVFNKKRKAEMIVDCEDIVGETLFMR